MAIKKLMETSIGEMWERCTDDESDIIVEAAQLPKVVETLFNAVSRCLGDMKLKEKPVAFVFAELNGVFNAGAVVKFHDGGNDAGDNWSYVWTFDKADIPEDAKIITLNDIPAQQYFNSYSAEKFHFGIETPCIANLYGKFTKVLSAWLEENANKDETVGVVLDGVFEARVDVEGEEIIKSIEPSGEIKTLIKNDAAIEK